MLFYLEIFLFIIFNQYFQNLVQELTNSSDFQSKSSVNTSNKDVKLQTAVQETNEHVHVLEGVCIKFSH